MNFHVGFLLSALLTGTSLLAQDQPFSIRVDIDTVIVDTVVQEQSGRFLTDLAQKDFEIFEDGQRQEVSYFAAAETPRSILLLFDLSGSTNTLRPFMSNAFEVFMTRMRLQDRLAVASFASEFQMLLNWRNVGGKPVNFLAPESQPRSDVFWAIEEATASFKNEKARKGIIVMTDGRDTSMFEDVMTFKRILDAQADKNFLKLVQGVRKQGIPIYFIALNTDRNRDLNGVEHEYNTLTRAFGPEAAERYLVAVRTRMERLADATGGHVLYPQTLADVAPLYDAIGRELGYAYSLGYSPKEAATSGKARRIEVRVRKSGLKITQSRDSYTR